MKKIILLITIIIFNSSAFADDYSETVLAKVGEEEITYQELEAAFQKNMNKDKKKLTDIKKDSLMNFLDLYVKYRLKVKDAMDRGFNEDPDVLSEIEQNEQLLTKSYYYDKNVLEPNVKEYLEQRDKYVKFSYIIFSFSQGENTPDSLKPKDKAQEVLDKIKSGELSFEDAAKQYSDDKRSGKYGGQVNAYIISGKIQRPLEKVIFNLDEGEICDTLVGTSYGYFILKVDDIKERNLVKAAHILIEKKGDSVTNAMEEKADMILSKLKDGESFERLAEKYSDDPASAINGGELESYYDLATGFEKSGSQLDFEFATSLYKLEDGETSGKIYTDFGIHIIKRLDTKKPDWEEEEDELTKYYKRVHYENDKQKYFNKNSEELGFDIKDEVLNNLLSKLDNNKTNLSDEWSNNIDSELKEKILFSYKSDNWTVGDFVERLNDKKNPLLRGVSLNKKGVNSAVKKIVEPMIMDDIAETLKDEYPEFKRLMREFYDGILLFKVEALEVWDKLKFDSTLAKKYYDTTSKEFYTDLKYDVSEIFILSDSTGKNLKKRIEKGESFEKLAEKYTQRNGFREKQGKHGLLVAGKNRFSNIIPEPEKVEEGMVIGPVDYQRGFSIIKINKIVKPRKKNFKEAIPDLASIIQEMKQKNLTDKWLDRVKQKHPVVIKEENIDEVYEKVNK